MKKKYLILTFLTSFFTQTFLSAQSPEPFVVKVKQPIAQIKSTMWGIFFEDINFAADGGIYAEMIKNRSFEFDDPLMGWKEQKNDGSSAKLLIFDRGEAYKNNPRYISVSLPQNQEKYGLINEGFRGMGVKKDMIYHFSLLSKVSGDQEVKLNIELMDSNGNIIGKASLNVNSNEWRQDTVSFKSSHSDPKAKLVVWFEGKGTIDLDMISLFPDDTWQKRPNGLRKDLVQLLADLKPGFIRFPGGCIVEGRDLESRYQWKKSVGLVQDRKMIVNRWNNEFKHRPTPDYFQSFGLGFFEYFQLAEDIGAQPLPILSCGMACQFNTSELVPLDQLDPYINDALDLIEFANAPADTKWGKIRASMGHPAPFNLKMIGVGNEQWGPQYIERYRVFAKAIKDKYPSINIVSGAGPFPDGEFFNYASKELKGLNADIIDEHYYSNPSWFLSNSTRYDNYDRKGPKIFAGEFAAQSVATGSPDNKNTWECALAEAAFMIGLERNAEVVNLCSYAPLFAHTEAWQWTPDLIWFDNLFSFGTPNYYVQKLFSNNKGSQVLPLLLQNKPVTGQNNLYASAALDEKTREVILKIVNSSDIAVKKEVLFEGVAKLFPEAKSWILSTTQLNSVNSLDNPQNISPVESVIPSRGKKLNLNLSPRSLTVIRIKVSWH